LELKFYNMKEKTVMVFGTFDLLHKGHLDFLKQAKKFGNNLIVVVARDETVKKVKGKFPDNNEKDRVRKIKGSGLVEMVLLGNKGADKYQLIKKYQPDVICLGYDQEFFIRNLRKELDENGLGKTKIIRLNSYYPNKYKSSILKNRQN